MKFRLAREGQTDCWIPAELIDSSSYRVRCRCRSQKGRTRRQSVEKEVNCLEQKEMNKVLHQLHGELEQP